MVEEFLIRNGLHESCYDFDFHVNDFMAEMEAGLSGKASSLRMLSSYIGVTPETPPNGDSIAIDAGGTNIRIARVHFSPDSATVVTQVEKHFLPGSKEEISKNGFFDKIVEYVGDRTDFSDKLGFCFSFPCEILPDREGKIIHFDKEVRVKDSQGALIGHELNAAFARVGKSEVKVTVLNDTAAALIGAVSSNGITDMGGYIGLIYGTGMNICYYENEKHMLINTEAGGYGGFKKSICDVEIDDESENPGDQRFEKMVSGAYFAKVALKVIKFAVTKGLFSEKAAEAINSLVQIDGMMIDSFMIDNCAGTTDLGKCCYNDEDVARLYEILDGLYERAAKLVAIAITAVLNRSGATEALPAYIVAEGSTFRKGFRFQKRFERYIAANSKNGKVYELMLADDHALIGAGTSVFL